MKHATLKDISKLTGLSISGVSRALSNHPDISPETRERVREVAAALNYHPNLNAQLLRTKSSKIIAAILPEVNTFFFPEMLQGISKIVEQHGYSLVFLQSDNSLQKESELIDYCLRMSVEGVLISLATETENLDHLRHLKEADTPVLLVDRIIENATFPYLTIDDLETTFKAIDYLIRKEHSCILGVFDDARLGMTRQRAEGFRQAHQKNETTFEEGQILMFADDMNFEEILTAALEKYPPASAIFTMSDKMMVNTYNIINRLGYKIPDDLALMSISDGKAPQYLHPGITHFRHSGEEVGMTSARFLFEMIGGKAPMQDFFKIETTLVKLGSA